MFSTKGIPLSKLFAQFQGKMSGFTKGRDRSFHFGTQDYKIVGMISHLGPQLGVADGIALANKLQENGQITAVFTGKVVLRKETSMKRLMWLLFGLPVIFIVENNGYGLSTPTIEQFRCEQISHKGKDMGWKHTPLTETMC